MFRFGVLFDALQGALDADVLVTDEASAVEWAGQHPLMVEGHADNLKITRPEDLRLAAYYLEQQAADGR
jgi:2-C-methyl-D-erythritol 4-phosphate cytidylyltransferase